MVKFIHFEYDMRRRERESCIRVKRGEREGERERGRERENLRQPLFSVHPILGHTVQSRGKSSHLVDPTSSKRLTLIKLIIQFIEVWNDVSIHHEPKGSIMSCMCLP